MNAQTARHRLLPLLKTQPQLTGKLSEMSHASNHSGNDATAEGLHNNDDAEVLRSFLIKLQNTNSTS